MFKIYDNPYSSDTTKAYVDEFMVVVVIDLGKLKRVCVI